MPWELAARSGGVLILKVLTCGILRRDESPELFDEFRAVIVDLPDSAEDPEARAVDHPGGGNDAGSPRARGVATAIQKHGEARRHRQGLKELPDALRVLPDVYTQHHEGLRSETLGQTLQCRHLLAAGGHQVAQKLIRTT